MKRLFTMLSVLLLALSGCLFTESQTRKTLDYGDKLKKASEAFDEARSKVKNSLQEATERAMEELKDDTPDPGKASEKFEGDWKDISRQSEDLEKKFLGVARAAREYFAEMERITAFEDDARRESQRATNRQLKARWNQAFLPARRSIVGLRRVRSQGSDFERLLRLYALRQSVEESIALLDAIAKEAESLNREAESLLVSLETFSEEAKALTAAGGVGQRFALDEHEK